MQNRNKKASKIVTLVLVSSVLSSCNQNQNAPAVTNNSQKVYMRADSTAPYTDVTQNYAQNQQSQMSGGMGSTLLWFMAFRALSGGGMGYASRGLHQQSNVGTNTAKSNAYKGQTTRGGFGSSAKSQRVSS